MVLTISICLLAAAFGVLTWWALVKRRLSMGNWLGSTAVLLWLGASGLKVYFDHTNTGDDIDRALRTAAGASWGSGRTVVSPPPSSRTASASEVASVGTVDSLIGGLEARLAEHPDDAKGWALLAQSYSFIGDTQRSERAVTRAVELGFEEADLRARVAHAKRDASPHPLVSGNGG